MQDVLRWVTICCTK